MIDSRYIVGIDLGTTNCAVGFVDTRDSSDNEGEGEIQYLQIPQLVHEGTVESRTLLPSFLYLPGPYELAKGSLALPWDAERKFAVGELARSRGAEVPQRLVSSAKSWLCYGEVDRRAPILPWQSPAEVEKVSPLEASKRYLEHIRETWNYLQSEDNPDYFLEHQQIFLTVPASFDAVARELTMEAARAAGLENAILLEEPQAAFYSWIRANEDWRAKVRVGDLILVCDIGGGTTDLSLIAVGEEEGNLVLNRVAVGEHILLGGDNMDLALAVAVQNKMREEGAPASLDIWQNRILWQSCRLAKETILNDPNCQEYPVTIPGRGSSLIGGTLSSRLSRQMVESVLVEGFFPACEAEDRPRTQRAVGLQEWGLPYAADAAVTRHLARFLGVHLKALDNFPQLREKTAGKKFIHPTAILFNGGVFKARLLQERVVEVINSWIEAEGGTPLRVLQETNLDLAVAHGAASYGLARRGRGIRIRGGAARSYYIGIETSMPSVPGFPPPIKALCVVPFGMEEGTEVEIPGQEFGLIVGEPADFRFFASSIRRHDQIGELIENWQEEIEELTSLEAHLTLEGQEGVTIPVRLHAHLTEIGTLELWFVSRDERNRWKLEFTVRKPYEEG
ncbi:MAG: Hsp70 family protein [bacterium]|nr:Hsp70 family protein [bacterium]